MSAPNDPLATPPPPPTPPPAPPPVSYAPPPAYVPPPAPPKKKKTWLIVLAVVVSVILLLMVGCIAFLYSFGKSHMAVTAEGAMLSLHSHMTKSEDAAIYDETDPLYKQNTTAAQSDAVFDRIHTLLGSPTHAQVMDNKTRTVDGAEVVDLYVLTTFTKGSANESIEYRKGADGMFHMTEYGAESDNLR